MNVSCQVGIKRQRLHDQQKQMTILPTDRIVSSGNEHIHLHTLMILACRTLICLLAVRRGPRLEVKAKDTETREHERAAANSINSVSWARKP